MNREATSKNILFSNGFAKSQKGFCFAFSSNNINPPICKEKGRIAKQKKAPTRIKAICKDEGRISKHSKKAPTRIKAALELARVGATPKKTINPYSP